MSTTQLALLVLLLPAAGAIVLAGRGWRLPRIVTQIVGPGVVWGSFVGVVALLWRHLTDPCAAPANRCWMPSNYDITYWTWIQSGSFQVPFNLLVDNLSIFMSLAITAAGGLIVTNSPRYMAHHTPPTPPPLLTHMYPP